MARYADRVNVLSLKASGPLLLPFQKIPGSGDTQLIDFFIRHSHFLQPGEDHLLQIKNPVGVQGFELFGCKSLGQDIRQKTIVGRTELIAITGLHQGL